MPIIDLSTLPNKLYSSIGMRKQHGGICEVTISKALNNMVVNGKHEFIFMPTIKINFPFFISKKGVQIDLSTLYNKVKGRFRIW